MPAACAAEAWFSAGISPINGCFPSVSADLFGFQPDIVRPLLQKWRKNIFSKSVHEHNLINSGFFRFVVDF